MSRSCVYSNRKTIKCIDTDEVVTGDKYLNSKHWKDFRKKIYDKYNGVCQECGYKFPIEHCHVHHISYKNVGKETDKDVRLLCSDCHNQLHKEKTRYKNMTSVDINLKAYIDCMNIYQKKDLIRYIERKHFR